MDNGAAPSSRVLACIRPEDVALERMPPAESSVRNHFPGTILSAEALGPVLRIRLDCGFPLLAYVTRRSYLDLGHPRHAGCGKRESDGDTLDPTSLASIFTSTVDLCRSRLEKARTESFVEGLHAEEDAQDVAAPHRELVHA